ncbi:branched-chain amino acid:cation transporter, LIVCS family [Chryseobacterium arachidis]|uniref:Branched-chain amino acid:cation transporter, LIVCS family n=1 Tax=Chryseobacterium arachidis TaxID=1416778 RepID=A0A1M4WGB4_9FLAO|nr:branched-chain amino acid:cation transporter, LIVCS family [Chryseobacterium arachidis]
MDEKTIINIGRVFFWTSFLLGNICLFGYIFTKNDSFVEGGLLVVGWGFAVNLSAVLLLIFYGIFNKPKLSICIKSILIMITNVPIAIIYIFLGIYLVCN